MGGIGGLLGGGAGSFMNPTPTPSTGLFGAPTQPSFG